MSRYASRHLRDTTLHGPVVDRGALLRDALSTRPLCSLSFRRCYRDAGTFHHPDNLSCNCLRTELPAEARAKSSGALGTPERNHTCPACSGTGEEPPLPRAFGFRPCHLCLATGELTAAGFPAKRSDRSIRRQLSKLRAAGKLGVK